MLKLWEETRFLNLRDNLNLYYYGINYL